MLQKYCLFYGTFAILPASILTKMLLKTSRIIFFMRPCKYRIISHCCTEFRPPLAGMMPR